MVGVVVGAAVGAEVIAFQYSVSASNWLCLVGAPVGAFVIGTIGAEISDHSEPGTCKFASTLCFLFLFSE